MQGDKLARGATSATFAVAPGLQVDQVEFEKDFKRLPKDEFKDKYLVSEHRYQFLKELPWDDESAVPGVLKEMESKLEAVHVAEKEDARREVLEDRPCFLEPFMPIGMSGKVIVRNDKPAVPKSQLALPTRLRKEKDLLPTTGHIIRAFVLSPNLEGINTDISDQFLGKRILFSPMSGTAVTFTGYAPWRVLDINEIICIIELEDAEILERELEPLS